ILRHIPQAERKMCGCGRLDRQACGYERSEHSLGCVCGKRTPSLVNHHAALYGWVKGRRQTAGIVKSSPVCITQPKVQSQVGFDAPVVLGKAVEFSVPRVRPGIDVQIDRARIAQQEIPKY